MRHILTLAASVAALASAAQNTYDSRIDAYRGLDFGCDGQLIPVLRIQNVGTATMNTCVVETWKNGFIGTSFNWILTIPAAINEFRQPALPPVNVDEGDTLEYRIISVNTQPDQGPTENILTRIVEPSPVPADGYTVMVEILTDDNPGETTWLIRDGLGVIIAQGGPYSIPNNLEQVLVSLNSNTCYQFEIYDSGGDGLSQGSRSVGYARVNNLGATLVEIDGGTFTSAADGGLKTGGDPCAPTQLTTTASPSISCGATGLLLNGTNSIHADEVPGANKYQFRFTNIPGQPAYTRNIAVASRSLLLKKWATLPLKAGRTYNVRVRASFNGGTTWCAFSTSCTITISTHPYPSFRTQEVTSSASTEPALSIHPNPSPDGSFTFIIDNMEEFDVPATIEVFDGLGRLVTSRPIALPENGTPMSFSMDGALGPGIYFVKLTAGTTMVTERLLVR